MNDENKKEIEKINENIAIQQKIAEFISASKYVPVVMSKYDERSLDAIIVNYSYGLKTELKEIASETSVIEKRTSIFNVYLNPIIGKLDKNYYFCSVEGSPYTCGIQKILTYNLNNARSSYYPILSSIDTKLLNLVGWNSDKIKSAFGVTLPSDVGLSRVFLNCDQKVFFLYSDNNSISTKKDNSSTKNTQKVK